MKGLKSIFTILYISIAAIQINAQELIIYIIPPPAEIKWDTPATLMKTTLINQLQKHLGMTSYPIGHLYVGLIHEERGEEMWSGMTRNQPNTAGIRVLRKGYGMGILFADIEGRLQQTGEVILSIDKISESGESSFLRFALSEENYLRLKRYLEEYRVRDYCRIYNGLNRPREGLGAGCAAFGESFLQLAGIPYEEWVTAWSADIRIQERLVGGSKFNRHVTILRQILTSKWASSDEPHYRFQILDPYYMHQWALENWDNHDSETLWIKEKKGNAKGLFMDFSNLAPPDEPIFFH